MRKNAPRVNYPEHTGQGSKIRERERQIETSRKNFLQILGSNDFRNNYWYPKLVLTKIFDCKEDVLDALLLNNPVAEWQKSGDARHYKLVSIPKNFPTSKAEELKPVEEGFLDYPGLTVPESEYFHFLRLEVGSKSFSLTERSTPGRIARRIDRQGKWNYFNKFLNKRYILGVQGTFSRPHFCIAPQWQVAKRSGESTSESPL